MGRSRMFLAWAAVCAVGACADGPPPGNDAPVRIHVQDAATGLPVAGVKVVVMDGDRNLPWTLPLVSDADGVCDFSPLRGVAPAVLAFGGRSWRVFGEPGLRDGVYPAEGAAADPTGLARPPAPLADLVRVVAIPPPRGWHIAGTVIDSVTGRPVGAAFVSLGRFLGGYGGGTTVSDDVTPADGTFGVSAIPFYLDERDRPVQAIPLVVACAGYRPRTWVYRATSGETSGDVTGVEIRLQPAANGATGFLRGRVLRGGEPVPDLVVGLGLGDRWTKEAAGLPGLTAVCDRDGVFVFADLPAGSYLVAPGYLPADAAWYPDQPANVPHAVAPGEVTDAGDFHVLWEIRAERPASGAVVTRDLRGFRWSPVPGAGAYFVALDGGEPAATTEPSWSLAPGDTLTPGGHVWRVYAVGAADEPLGTTDGFAEFLVVR